ncbi:PmbA protein [Dissulfurispira thermophila]|uniref:PmbA protein n=2 Tax=root TaxID=1 RepID=A0A7G1H177_9BACT|nr:TldD/PmbA family protein [Dissulfurispira thermophila]BCB96514.1 PmbA protein [Dissulfurispira thermophila]
MNTEFALKLMEIALKIGADEAEVYVKTSKNLSVEVKEQKIDTLESSMTTGYCIRVIKDNRLGFSYSTNPDEIDIVAKNAIEAAKHSEPDDYLGLPSAIQPAAISQPLIFDNNIASLSEKEAINLTLLIESSAFSEDSRIKKIRKASGSFSISNTYITNSKGISAHYQSTGCSAQLMAIAEEGSESQLGWDYQGSRFLKDVSFEEVGRTAAHRAAKLLGARKINSIKGFVLLDNAVSTEFLGILSSALSSESVQKSKSMLAGKKGEVVISNRLNIIDSGLLDRKLGSKPFDDEGVPTSHKILIEKGVLNGYLYNTYTAKKEGIVSTGNAIRGGFTGIPTIGPTNLYIESASKEYTNDLHGLVKTVNRGLYVIETMGMHTANPISGEFSVGASGLWIENGEIMHPVKEAVISGNILDLFKKVVMIGDDMRFYGNIGSPSLLIEQIDISG